MTVWQQIVENKLKYEKNDIFQPISCFCDLDLDLKYIIYEIWPYFLRDS